MALIFRKRDDLRFKSICEIWNVQNSVVNERLAADRHFPKDWAVIDWWEKLFVLLAGLIPRFLIIFEKEQV